MIMLIHSYYPLRFNSGFLPQKNNYPAIVVLIYNNTIVMMMGPNKTIKPQKTGQLFEISGCMDGNRSWFGFRDCFAQSLYVIILF